jgi:hypothetical protein
MNSINRIPNNPDYIKTVRDLTTKSDNVLQIDKYKVIIELYKYLYSDTNINILNEPSNLKFKNTVIIKLYDFINTCKDRLFITSEVEKKEISKCLYVLLDIYHKHLIIN